MFVVYIMLLSTVAISSEKVEITAQKVEFRKAKKQIIFTGSVKLSHKSTMLVADYILQDERLNFVEAKGNVSGNYSNKIFFTAEKVLYFPATKECAITDSPVMIYKSSMTEITISAYNVLCDGMLNKIHFLQKVVITQNLAKVTSDEAVFDLAGEKLFLSKKNAQPKYFYESDYKISGTCDQIVVSYTDRKVAFYGSAVAKFYLPPKKL